MRCLPIALAAVACSGGLAPSDASVHFLEEGAPDTTLPPPTFVSLSAPDFVSSSRLFELTVSGALEEETVYLIGAGAEAAGEGPCPRPLGGYCLDLTRPVGIAGIEVVGPDGGATVVREAPPYAGATNCFQAAIMRGIAGVDSALSNVVCVDFCADVDGDGDGFCDEFDACLGDDRAGDTDGDGACDDADPCPLDFFDDSDGDSICDSEDLCPGADDALDTDDDGIPDACDGPPRGLYAAEGRNGSRGTSFHFIDVDAGTSTYVADLEFALTGLSFDSDGVLWGIEANGVSASRIVQVDPETGTFTHISTTSVGIQPSAFAWHSDGILYGWTESGDDLVTIDPWSGAVSVQDSGIGTYDNCAATIDGQWIMKVATSFYNFGASPTGGSWVGMSSGLPWTSSGNGCAELDGYFYMGRGDTNLWRCDVWAASCTDTGIWIDDGIDALAGWN